MQIAIHGVSLFIQTKDPGAKPRSSPLQRCHDWINIVSILGDHRLVELLVQMRKMLQICPKKPERWGPQAARARAVLRAKVAALAAQSGRWSI
jgi:hypothetical protein